MFLLVTGGESQTSRKLIEMARANEGLRIFAADVLDYHSIIDALEGCSGLFYAFDQIQNAAEYDVRLPFGTRNCRKLDSCISCEMERAFSNVYGTI